MPLTEAQKSKLGSLMALQGLQEDDYLVVEEREDAAELVIGGTKGRPKFVEIDVSGAVRRHVPC